MAQERPGYVDTERLPDQEWRVHDAERPYPPVVEPGPAGGPVPPPEGAVVLFGGREADLREHWLGASDGDAAWKVGDGAMEVNGTGDLRTRVEFGDCWLHVEWQAPAKVEGDGQGRGNSGVFLMGRYEVQILDSHANPTYADGQAAALYGQFPPEVNASRQPGEWQTFDIVFLAPRFDADGRLVRKGRVTVIHNGFVVHAHREILGATAHRDVARYQPHGPAAPLRLQDHGNPVRFRNVWVLPLETDGE